MSADAHTPYELTKFMPAPVIVFAYRRPDHLDRCLQSLALSPMACDTHLTIYCDGARTDADRAATLAVRKIAYAAQGFSEVVVRDHDDNWGLANSMVFGVTQALLGSDRVIVVEDDLEVAPGFLSFMNDGLTLYSDDAQVASIHGYTYPVHTALPESFFLRGADCWGWATWKRAWRVFENDPVKLLATLQERKLTRSFDFDGAYPYTEMLRDRITGRNNSWAVLWHASTYLRDMLTLYPGQSLVHNIGNDGSGTHSARTVIYDTRPSASSVRLQRIALAENAEARQAFANFLREPRWRRAARRVRSLVTS